MKRIPSLDGLRAVAIAMVCLSHFAQTKGSPLHNFSSFGNLGVRVFFVISGYLITQLLLEERQRTGRISLKRFYFRRTLRIFPAMWFYMAVILALNLGGVIGLASHDWWRAFTYTVNYDRQRSWYIGHLWSLSVEEQFYLIWPFALWFGGQRRATKLAILAVVAGPILRLASLLTWPDAPILEWFPTTCDAIATGCILALIPAVRLRQWTASWIASPWVGLVPLLAIFINSLQFHVDRRYMILFSTAGLTVMNLCIALTIYRFIVYYRDFSGRVLNSGFLVWLGTISYSLYLWQQPFLNHDVSSWVTRFPVNLIAALAMAAVSYYCVERPLLAARKRVTWLRESPTPRLFPAAGVKHRLETQPTEAS
jgi:peptidoglycan/LPS O-acetylase OafA/YrhL